MVFSHNGHCCELRDLGSTPIGLVNSIETIADLRMAAHSFLVYVFSCNTAVLMPGCEAHALSSFQKQQLDFLLQSFHDMFAEPQ